jgi:hypothetical protein
MEIVMADDLKPYHVSHPAPPAPPKNVSRKERKRPKRNISATRVMLNAAFVLLCVSLVIYHLIDLLHVSEYMCDSRTYHYLNLPVFSDGPCHRVWKSWIFTPEDPDPLSLFLIFGLFLAVVFVAAAYAKTWWHQKQLDWLLKAALSQTSRLVLRTQFEIVNGAIKESEETLTRLGLELLKEITQARPFVLFDSGNSAEIISRLALKQHEFWDSRRSRFLSGRGPVRDLVQAMLDTLDGSFAGAWHAIVRALYAQVGTKEPVAQLEPLARIFKLPWNPRSPGFEENLAKVADKGGLTWDEYLSVILPLQLALYRREWVDELEMMVKITIIEKDKPNREVETTLHGARAAEIMRGFLISSPWPIQQVVDDSEAETEVDVH